MNVFEPQKSVSLDPRVALVSFAVVVLAAMFVPTTLPGMGVFLAYVLAVHFASGGRLSEALRHVRRMGVFFLAIVAINAFVVEGRPLLTVAGRATVTAEGVTSGLYFGLRLFVLYLAMMVLLRVTPPDEFARGVFGLARPFSTGLASRLAFHSYLSMSFLPLFGREFDRIRVAQSFRGATMSGGLRRRVTAVRSLLMPLILSAIHRSGQLAMVVELRGLRDRLGQSLRPLHISARDVAFLASAMLVVVAVAVWF